MADITKCSGHGCLVKEKCYRFTAEAGMRQSYFVEVPGKIEEGEFKCDMYWGEGAEHIWKQLKEITNAKTD
jgi:hypothetical protein